MFKASRYWLYIFVRRTVIRSSKLHIESGAVDPEYVLDSMLDFFNLLEKYEPEHIYTEDESGLVYQILPGVSYLAQEEDMKVARGVKNMTAKNRITFTMYTNADGSHVVNRMFINKAKRPIAFDLTEPSLHVETSICRKTTPV